MKAYLLLTGFIILMAILSIQTSLSSLNLSLNQINNGLVGSSFEAKWIKP